MVRASAIASALLAIAAGAAYGQERYILQEPGGATAIVFVSLSRARDAIQLSQAGSTTAALRHVKCTIEKPAEVVVSDGREWDFTGVLVLTGDKAGCKGYAVRTHLRRIKPDGSAGDWLQ